MPRRNDGEYEKLNLSEFVAGFLVMIKTYDEQLKEAFLAHLELLMHLSIEIPTPPTPGQGGGMWGIFMAFEGTVCPWGWGISQHLHLHIH